jgi:cytoskeleton protein RodZ
MRDARAAPSGSGGSAATGATAGALLVAAREARGLSVEAVAQQLKLSARQVRALEEGDFTLLPGRTFVRGFLRNYARLVALDPELVLDALPGSAATPTLAAPTLHPTAPTRGELPTSERTKAPWTRWAIPVSLAAVVATAAIYEWARPAVANRTQSTGRESNAVTPVPAQPPVAEKIETPFPNPLSGGPAAPTTQDATPASPSGAQRVAPSSPEPLETKGTTNAS